MTTLIIGATGGIGAAMARAMAGADSLILAGRDEAKLSALAAELGSTALGSTAQRVDVGFESHVRSLLDGVESLDTVIYAAGAALPQPLADLDAAQVRAVWNANYFGAVWTLKYALPKLMEGGRMYLIGARPELVTAKGFSQYAASKAALAQAVTIARLELPRGTQKALTLVLPPAVDTPLWTQVGRMPRGAISAEAVAQAIAADRSGAAQGELRVEG
ncbi:SDR family NAD(P)-dependent oxidoreductase [Deinococcus sp. QL22]|uniref:SDR family NAD(P)-dependent oxidoreductase n=1 Tax=Deinococcus sp. QL22 TaxID=2939437 RepID=UPI002016CC3B|nr:SDR family NAD(P)-dependent oxidoreductase [Deinococcus sp. QL22]UQN05209.1 SDR family NAD(P)-dependent oxidoreductase [Deinococcus sp. QL22]